MQTLALAIGFMLASALAGAAWAQDEEGTTPGQLPDPGTYQGSVQLQQQSDQQDQQFRQQQQQPSEQPSYNQPAYNQPAYGAAAGQPPRRSSSSSHYSAAHGRAEGGGGAPAMQGALVRFQVGASAAGAFTPLGGAHLWVTPRDPVEALNAAGIQPIGSSLAQLSYDCQVAWVCVRDFKVMTAGAIGVVTTDAAGHAQTSQIPAGRYFVIGYAAVKGGTLVWSSPMRVTSGENTLSLDQADGFVVAAAQH